MKKNNSDVNFVLKGRVVSDKDHNGIAGVVIKAVDSGSKKERERTISNEDGGFHFLFEVKDPSAACEVLLNLFDVNNKQLRGTEKAIPLRAVGEESYVELTVDDEEIQSHRANLRTIKPRFGRVFPAEKLNEIYSAINQFGNTSKKYFMSGGMRPGLTCPFPEMNDYDNILFDAWETIRGDVLAFDRFKNTLDTIAFSMSRRGGVKTSVDFQSEQWREFIDAKRNNNERARVKSRSGADSSPGGWLAGLLKRVWKWLTSAKPETREHRRVDNNPMMSLESTALLMLAADYIARKDDKLSNHYKNIVFTQLLEFSAVAPVYKTAHNALHGDVRSQADLRTMIEILGEDCGGPRPPLEGPGGLDVWDPTKALEPEVEGRLSCLDEMVENLASNIWAYRIDSMSPSDGCSGDTAILNGSEFQPGAEVRFVGPTIDSFVNATPTRVSDTEIEFVIPPGATYGPVSLYYPYRRGAYICGTLTSDAHRNVSERPTIFTGGEPRIDSITFLKDDMPFDPLSETVSPGDAITLVYENTRNAPVHIVQVFKTQIQIEDGRWAAPPVELDPYEFEGFNDPGRTTLLLPSTDFEVSTRITCVIALTNACGTKVRAPYFIVHRPAVISLTDIEVTQGIQFLNADEHMGNSSEVRDDNSVPLVANKRTLVRVFYKTDQLDTFNQGKSFGLSVSLRGYMDGKLLGGSPLAPFNEDNLFALNDTDPETQRGKLTTSANFLLPDEWTNPTRRTEDSGGELNQILDTPLRLVAELGIKHSEPWIRDTIDPDNDQFTLRGLRFNMASTMSVVVVRVKYTGPGNNDTDFPTLDECRTALILISRAYPTHELEVLLPLNADDRFLEVSEDLTADTDGQPGCGDAWGSLMFDLKWRAFFITGEVNSVWAGFLHPDIEFGDNKGCGGPTVGAVGVVAIPVGTARKSFEFRVSLQEFAHSYGISAHADESDSGFPDYDGSGNPIIGEFGVDVGSINTANLSDLDDLVINRIQFDFMKSDGGNWYSPFTFEQLMDWFCSTHEPGEVESSSALKLRPSSGEQIYISGSIDTRNNQVSINPIFHLPGKFTKRRGLPSGYEIVWLDSNGRVIQKVPIQRHGDEEDPLYIFERLPLIRAAKHLEIRDSNQTTIWKIDRADEPPTLQDLHLEKKEGRYMLTWRSGSRAEEIWCGVQLTCDDGENWSTLNRPEQIQTYSFDPSKFGGGEQCRLRVFVTDGFNTTHKETESFSLPIEPPEIHPVNFDSETEFFAGIVYNLKVQPVYILGVPHKTELTWYLNKKEIGKGRKIGISFEPGEQLIEVIPSGFEKAALTVSITVKEKK